MMPPGASKAISEYQQQQHTDSYVRRSVYRSTGLHGSKEDDDDDDEIKQTHFEHTYAVLLSVNNSLVVVVGLSTRPQCAGFNISNKDVK